MNKKDKFITNNKETKKCLKVLNKKKNRSNFIIRTLNKLGDFDSNIEVRLLKDNRNVTLIALDKNNILYKIYLSNLDPLKNNNIEICNENHDMYHVSQNEELYNFIKVGSILKIDNNNYISEYHYPNHNYYEINMDGKLFYISIKNTTIDINLLKECIINKKDISLSEFYFIIEQLLDFKNDILEKTACIKNGNMNGKNYSVLLNDSNYTVGVESKRKIKK